MLERARWLLMKPERKMARRLKRLWLGFMAWFTFWWFVEAYAFLGPWQDTQRGFWVQLASKGCIGAGLLAFTVSLAVVISQSE